MLREEISDNALEGKYVFHEYAATNWLELVERASQAGPDDTAYSDLIHALETLLKDRSNPSYIGEFESAPLTFKAPKYMSPELHGMLEKASQFRRQYSASQHKKKAGTLISPNLNLDAVVDKWQEHRGSI